MPAPTEDAILSAMRQAYESPKLALTPVGWRADRQAPAVLRCPIVCQCSDPRVAGVELRGTANAGHADEHVSFQLLIDFAGRAYGIARIDWKPRSPHTNRYGGQGVRGLTIEGSQIHDFEENAALGLSTMMTGNLPICLGIDPDPPDFPSLMGYVRDKLALTNASDIPVPPWSSTLL